MITKFKLDRMKRNVARSTPDTVFRTFDPIRGDSQARDFEQWKEHFVRMMKVKHGDDFKSVIAYQSDFNPPLGTIRVQLVVQLWSEDGRG